MYTAFVIINLIVALVCWGFGFYASVTHAPRPVRWSGICRDPDGTLTLCLLTIICVVASYWIWLALGGIVALVLVCVGVLISLKTLFWIVLRVVGIKVVGWWTFVSIS